MRNLFQDFMSFNNILRDIEEEFNKGRFDVKRPQCDGNDDVYEFRMTNDNGKKDYYFRHNDVEETFTNAKDCLEMAKEELSEKKKAVTEEILAEETPMGETVECPVQVAEEVEEQKPAEDYWYKETRVDDDNESYSEHKPFYVSDMFVTFEDARLPRPDEIVRAFMYTKDGELCMGMTIEPHSCSLYTDLMRPGKQFKDSPIFLSYTNEDKTCGGSFPLCDGFEVVSGSWDNAIVDDCSEGKERNCAEQVAIPFRMVITLKLLKC